MQHLTLQSRPGLQGHFYDFAVSNIAKFWEVAL
jgi:hypothetical protein